MDARELFDAAVKLRDSGGFADVAAVITTGRKSHLLWLSKGDIRKAKKLLRRGIAECFLKIHSNGDGRWRADAVPLPGVDEKRAQHLLWSFGRTHFKWSNGLH